MLVLLLIYYYQDLAPENFLIFSKDSQNVSDHGAIRSQHGMKPLYRAKNPSCFIVLVRQSSELLYKIPENANILLDMFIR